MTGFAADTLRDVDRVIEEDEIGERVHASPGDRATGLEACAHGREGSALDQRRRVAADASDRRRQSGARCTLGGSVAVAAIDTQGVSVDSMIERHRLRNAGTLACRERRANPDHEDQRHANRDDDGGDDTPPGHDIGPTWKECGHDWSNAPRPLARIGPNANGEHGRRAADSTRCARFVSSGCRGTPRCRSLRSPRVRGSASARPA